MNESTHATNIANLLRANETSKGLGSRYAPARDFIKPAVIDAFATDCEARLTGTYNRERDFETARDERKSSFERLAPFATRIVNALVAGGAPKGVVDEARALVKKLRGQRATKKAKPAASDAPAEEIVQQISVSQMSFESRLANFRKLVQAATGLGAGYNPSSADLKADALSTKLSTMDRSNKAVTTALAAFSTALIDRDRLLYDEQTGLVARMEAIRAEYKSAFGVGSAEHKMLSGLRVKSLRNKRLEEV